MSFFISGTYNCSKIMRANCFLTFCLAKCKLRKQGTVQKSIWCCALVLRTAMPKWFVCCFLQSQKERFAKNKDVLQKRLFAKQKRKMPCKNVFLHSISCCARQCQNVFLHCRAQQRVHLTSKNSFLHVKCSAKQVVLTFCSSVR